MFKLIKGLQRVTGFQGFALSQSCRVMASSNAFTNRLSIERSPYLLQHANNPVDWYPWGEEAFKKAREENKIIFLSVGYSTCHWCHVMERESFENEEIGKILSEKFVPIKVDREERPDVDRIYMTFIQATGTGGGWPMSVWLTPDLKPIIGGTYFPPDNRYYGRPGFKTVLNNILEKWESDGETMLAQGSSVVTALLRHTAPASTEDAATVAPPSLDVVDKCYAMLERKYDDVMGGFGQAPKFPQPGNFVLLYRVFGRDRDSEQGVTALNMCLHTLRMMNKGGIHDHVAKGFHRYSTDGDWHVPHFEKMLYDQAQLTTAYADAYQISKDEEFAEVVRDVVEYVNRDLSHKSGGFYSAEDADSLPTPDSQEKKEGAFCVWSEEEIHEILADVEAPPGVNIPELFCHHYNVHKEGNVDPYKDPHDELKHKNVLIVRGSEQSTAEKFKMEPEGVKAILGTARQKLFQERCKRPPPHLDNKMITAWNGLLISGLARAAQALSEPAYVDRARQAVQFLRTHILREDGRILRAAYVGEDGEVAQCSSQPIYGFSDDYAFVIRGLLDLYEACYDDKLLEWAEQLQKKMTELFWDDEAGGYFNSPADDKTLVLRLKDDQDGAEPSANSVAAMNLLRLSHFLSAPALHQQATQLLQAFSHRLSKIPVALPEMAAAVPLLHDTTKQIIIVGDPAAADTRALLSCVHTHFLPNKVLMVADGNRDGFLYDKVAVLRTLTRVDGKATAYVCENYACQLPVTSVDQLEEVLAQ